MSPAVSERQRRYMGYCLSTGAKGCPSKEVSREFARKPVGGYPGKKAKKGRKRK